MYTVTGLVKEKLKKDLLNCWIRLYHMFYLHLLNYRIPIGPFLNFRIGECWRGREIGEGRLSSNRSFWAMHPAIPGSQSLINHWPRFLLKSQNIFFSFPIPLFLRGQEGEEVDGRISPQCMDGRSTIWILKISEERSRALERFLHVSDIQAVDSFQTNGLVTRLWLKSKNWNEMMRLFIPLQNGYGHDRHSIV